MDWRIYRENPDFSEITLYDRSSSTRSKIDKVYTDTKITSNTKIIHMMVSFTDHYNTILLTDFPQKLKLEEIHGTL